MIVRSIIFVAIFLCSCFSISAQKFGLSEDVVEVGESMKAYIQENHLEDIEDIVHKFTTSRIFLKYLLEQGHHINVESLELKRKDVRVGDDIDIYVKHFTEHQNFTMLMIPVDIYPLVIYDTLLFSVLEVSDQWLKEKYYSYDITVDSVKSSLLAIENHELLTKHMYNQVLRENRQTAAEIEVRLHESYISTNSVSLHTTNLTKKERKRMTESWGFLKRALTHNLNLNVEMNIYIFGHDDMEIIQYLSGDQQETYKITPRNVFTRHHFLDEEDN